MLPIHGGRECNYAHLWGKREREKRGGMLGKCSGGGGGNIPGDLTNIYCIFDASLAVVLNSTASHKSQSQEFGAV